MYSKTHYNEANRERKIKHKIQNSVETFLSPFFPHKIQYLQFSFPSEVSEPRKKIIPESSSVTDCENHRSMGR